jgi:hypothetical protein
MQKVVGSSPIIRFALVDDSPMPEAAATRDELLTRADEALGKSD